jgi:nucleoside-diphosphate-sugar epimerase
VAGTERILSFAELVHRHGGLHRLIYVSTAYVAGLHSGVFDEDDLGVGQRFRNSDERSKFEAEALVRSCADGLPIAIVP